MEVDQHLSETEEAELYRYYGLQYGGTGYQAGTAEVTTDATTNQAHTGTTRTSGDGAAMTLSEEGVEVGKESHEARTALDSHPLVPHPSGGGALLVGREVR